MRPGGMHSLNLDVFDPAVTLRCCALLAYVIGHYRRLALTVHLFPIDPREQTPSRPGRRFRSRKQPVLLKRSTQQIRPLEMVLTILALPIFALLAQYLWLIITAAPRNILGFPPQLSRFFLLSWLAFLGLYAASALLDYWRWRRMTSAQAQLYLQDLLWQETRREQRRLNRWLAIEHLRGRTAKQITPSPRLRGEGRNCVTPTYRPGSSSKSKSPWYP